MSWEDLLKTLAGPLIGAFIALVAIWVKEFIEKRKTVQTWFEQHYIIEGVDSLIAYFIALEAFIIERQFSDESFDPRYAPPLMVDSLPPDLIAKIESILQSRIFVVSALFIRRLAMNKNSNDLLGGHALHECLRLAKKYNDILTDLRKELLQIRLKKKTDIYKIAERKGIAALLDRMNQIHIEMASSLGISFKTDTKGHLLLNFDETS